MADTLLAEMLEKMRVKETDDARTVLSKKLFEPQSCPELSKTHWNEVLRPAPRRKAAGSVH